MDERPERTIYIIAASPTGPIKVGVSNEPSKRLAQLQTGHSERLSVFYEEAVKATHTLLLEGLIHKQLNHVRLVGEWFDIDVETAIAEVKFGIIRWESDDSLDRLIKAKQRRLTKR